MSKTVLYETDVMSLDGLHVRFFLFRKSRKNFDKYCAPLLHLAGISVNVIQTEFEGQARGLVESLDEIVDAIVVAGGDGTVSEVTI
jgi:diacylglycerol kinase family enzyme